MGFFAGLNEEKYDRQYKDSDLAKRMLSFFTPQKGRMAAILGLVMLMAGLGAALPVIVSAIMDLLAERPTVEAILLVGGGMTLIAFLNWGLKLDAARPDGTGRRRCGPSTSAPAPFEPPPNTIYRSTTNSPADGSSAVSRATPTTSANWS